MRRGPLIFAAALTASVAVAPAAQQRPTAYRYAVPPTVGDGWTTASLEQAGIDVKRIESMTDSIRAHPELNVHAVLIERDGHLVFEEYFSGKDERWGAPLGVVVFTRDTRHDLRSVTKSVVSALVGIANNTGAVTSLDTPLLDWFPEYKDLQVPERRRITIRHALMMGSGLEWNENVPYTDPKNDEIVMTRNSDPLHYLLSRPILSPPGTTWNYNGGMTHGLGAILQRATQQPLADFARDHLFTPLGITDFEWVGNLAGVPAAASGLRLRPRDLAKFGSLYIHGGQWKGQQVIPRAWVDESTRRRLAIRGGTRIGYAYQWWVACHQTASGPLEVPMAVGNGDQRVFLLRDHQAVVTVLAGRYNDFSSDPAERLLLDFIIPALPAAPRSGCHE